MAWPKTTRISIMLGIDLAFFFLELGTGIYVGSLALMADAFHMLNDVISLAVGLWAVRVAQKATTDKFSYGWLRAEILGAFFNAVFLIALCVSIILEALTRFIDPPEISNPFFILIVGSLGLFSNLVGFFVLGGHNHSHGAGHDDGSEGEHGGYPHTDGDQIHGRRHGTHDVIRHAEEGRFSIAQAENRDGRSASPATARHISFDRGDSRATGWSRGQHRRRASSLRHSRFTNIEDLSIHPASFRQEIIAASRSQDMSDESSSEEDVVDGGSDSDNCVTTENTSLLGVRAGPGAKLTATDSLNGYSAVGYGTETRRRRDSSGYDSHNHADGHDHVDDHYHDEPRKSQKGGHSHGHGHSHSHADMGMQAMILHVIGDALGNVGVILTALVIWKTTWTNRFYADPAVSLFITLIILRSAVPLTLATAKILLQATPDHIDVNRIKLAIQRLPGVISCHHIHIWQLSDTKLVASLHIQVAFPISEEGGEKYMKLSRRVRAWLHGYGIHSATIQPEFCLDDSHQHGGDIAVQTDGTMEPVPSCGTGGPDSLCLLECVDGCVGQGCCPSTSSSPPEGTSYNNPYSPPRTGNGGEGHDNQRNDGHDHEQGD